MRIFPLRTLWYVLASVILIALLGCSNHASNLSEGGSGDGLAVLSNTVPGRGLVKGRTILPPVPGGVIRSTAGMPFEEDNSDETTETRGISNRVLVLYDSTGTWGWMGQLYSVHLKNLLSHFRVPLRRVPVEQYRAGMMKNFDAVFYLGALYGTPLSDAFKKDMMAYTKPFCWMGSNLWQVAWDPTMANVNPAFESKFGFRFVGLDNSGCTEIRYKGVSLTKAVYDQAIYKTQILNPSLAQPVATCINGGSEVPYIIKSGKFWFVADDPFVYVSETDRYLAFADAMHDILGINHAERHRAFLRIEDVSAKSDPVALRAVADYLSSQGVPFAVCVIPEYRDPLGAYTDGKAEIIKLSQAPKVVSALKYMVARGGQIVQHGYTHQYSNIPNPYDGTSADDFEFFRITLDSNGNQVLNGAVAEDSLSWAYNRVASGRVALLTQGLNSVAWNTPHYLASATDYRAFRMQYNTSLDRGLYFVKANNTSYYLQQLAPFVIYKDQFGMMRIPETIGYIDPWGWGPQPPTLAADLVKRANADWVVRDGWAGCYFHPFLDIQYLKDLVMGIKGRGYQFVSVTSVN